MRKISMKRMPVVVRSTGHGAVVLDMDLPDEAFGADGLPKNGYVINDDVRCWVEIDDFGHVTRQQMTFGELNLA